jgi:hypothetical protein
MSHLRLGAGSRFGNLECEPLGDKMHARMIAFAVAVSAAGLCQAQTPDAAASGLVAGCTSEAAYGVPFGERSDRMFMPTPNAAPYRAMTTLRRTPNSRQLHMAETVVELPDDATAMAFAVAVETAAVASGRFPTRAVEEDSEITTLTATDGSVRIEISTLGRGAYVTCVKPAFQQLAMDEALGRVRVATRPSPPTLSLPPRPDREICGNSEARTDFVQGFESALQNPMEYASALNAHSSTLQQWYGQQLKEKTDFSEEDDAALAMRTLNDQVFSTELAAGFRHLSTFMRALVTFADARDAGNGQLACTQAIDVLALVDNMSASSQRQWGRIEALYREEATRRGVTLD